MACRLHPLLPPVISSAATLGRAALGDPCGASDAHRLRHHGRPCWARRRTGRGPAQLRRRYRGIGVELSVITAAVLGGASLRGGEGSVLGGVLGVLFIALVQNALIINGIGVFWQNIIIGLVLLLAVSLDRFKQTHRG